MRSGGGTVAHANGETRQIGQRKMGRKPQRARAKRPVQIRAHVDVRNRLTPLLRIGRNGDSLSQVVENMLFVMEVIYNGSGRERLMRSCYETKARQLMEVACAGTEPEQRLVHVTVDPEAIAFADLMVRRHRRLFASRRDLGGLLLYYACTYCENEELARYFVARLEQAARLHPLCGLPGARE